MHDLNGVLLYINPAAAQALGYAPQDGIGKKLSAFLAPSICHLFEAYLERIRHNPIDSGLLRVLTKDGRERVWSYHNVRYTEAGQAPYVLGHAQDITERIQLEEELRTARIELGGPSAASPRATSRYSRSPPFRLKRLQTSYDLSSG
jgi:PAS domain S-box-containing protein